MKVLLWCILSLLLVSNTWSQGPSISGDFNNVAFREFSIQVERQVPVTFYFQEEWTRDILINASGEGMDLLNVLRDNFSGKNLSVISLERNKIVIIKGENPISILPDYNPVSGGRSEVEEEHNGNGLTEAEKLYIEGRKASPTETLFVGEEDEYIEGKTSVVSGVIKDKETGEPLIGATIYLEELAKGVVTDVNGHFTMAIPAGNYNTLFSCLGMEEIRYRLEVRSDGVLNIEMGSKLYPIDEIVVKSSTYHNVRGTQMGFTQISIKNIKEIPMVMGEKDVLKVVQMLPGVQTSGEASTGIHVRGSSADQNMFIINKVPIYNTSHLFGFFSAFNPDMIKDFSFYKSNLPAKYGGKLASVIDITGRQGSNKRFTARGGISPITAHMAVEGPIIKDKSSFILSARSNYSNWILKRINNPEIRNSNPRFYDLAGGITVQPNEQNLVKLFGYNSEDRFSLALTDSYQYSNAGASLNWWHKFSSTLNTDISAIFSQYQFQHDNLRLPLEAYRQNYQIRHSELRSDFLWIPLYRHKITFGANMILYDLDRGEIQAIGSESIRKPVLLGAERGLEGGLYMSDQFQVTDQLTLNAGFRYSLYDYRGPQNVNVYSPGNPVELDFITDSIQFDKGKSVKFYSGPEWRFSLNQLLGMNSSVKLSYNKTRQYLFMLSNTVAISPTDQWKLSDYHIVPPMADQVSLGFYHDFSFRDMNFSAEGYYKRANNIVDYKDGASFISSPYMETHALQGLQKAYGMELMLKKNAGKWTGWMSMAYSRSMIKIDGENTWDRINQGEWYPANYDIPMSVNSVMNYRVNRRLSVSGNMVYHTGRPVTYPIGLFDVEGKKYIGYSSRNEYRIPDYFRMDLSINLEGNLRTKKVGHSFWMISIYNLTGRDNAYSVFFETRQDKIQGYKMSIFSQPIATLSWNFKFGNYASD